MKSTEFRINLQGLEDLKKQLGGKYRARVGILGADVQRPGGVISNSELGLIQLVGSHTNNIPARDWLRMPIQLHAKDIVKTMQGSTVKRLVEAGQYKKVIDVLGQAARGWVLKAFDTGGFGQWAANKPSTIKRKGSSKPLIDTSELRKSVSSDVVSSSKAKGGGA